MENAEAATSLFAARRKDRRSVLVTSKRALGELFAD
jgi:hypothetical protein